MCDSDLTATCQELTELAGCLLPSTNKPEGLSIVCKAGTWYVAPVGHPTPYRGEGPTFAAALGDFKRLITEGAQQFLIAEQGKFEERTERVRLLLVGRGDVVQDGGADDRNERDFEEAT